MKAAKVGYNFDNREAAGYVLFREFYPKLSRDEALRLVDAIGEMSPTIKRVFGWQWKAFYFLEQERKRFLALLHRRAG